MQKSEQLVIEALAFIRGRSLSETYCIIDEAQNLTPHEIKTIITRAGEGTKMVFTGDIQQIDQPYLDSQSNGLVYMIDRMKDQNLFAHVNLLKGERSQLSELASNLMKQSFIGHKCGGKVIPVTLPPFNFITHFYLFLVLFDKK